MGFFLCLGGALRARLLNTRVLAAPPRRAANGRAADAAPVRASRFASGRAPGIMKHIVSLNAPRCFAPRLWRAGFARFAAAAAGTGALAPCAAIAAPFHPRCSGPRRLLRRHWRLCAGSARRLKTRAALQGVLLGHATLPPVLICPPRGGDVCARCADAQQLSGHQAHGINAAHLACAAAVSRAKSP